LVVIYEGRRRREAAALGGVGLQIIRDWVLRFSAEGPEGLIDRKPPGALPKLNDAQCRALCEIVESRPIPTVHGVVRWRLKDLVQWLWDEFQVSVDESTVSRELKASGFVKISARPRHHEQNVFVREDFKKASPPRWQRSGPGCRPAPR
jgi:transposase